jgi:hypothetical protein
MVAGPINPWGPDVPDTLTVTASVTDSKSGGSAQDSFLTQHLGVSEETGGTSILEFDARDSLETPPLPHHAETDSAPLAIGSATVSLQDGDGLSSNPGSFGVFTEISMDYLAVTPPMDYVAVVLFGAYLRLVFRRRGKPRRARGTS